MRLRRALQLANFVHEKGGRDALPEGLWRRILSRKWYRAGRQLLQLGRQAEARDVFRRSFGTWTWNWPARLNWLLVSMRLAIRPARRPPDCGTVLE